jgi:hypothetical protein
MMSVSSPARSNSSISPGSSNGVSYSNGVSNGDHHSGIHGLSNGFSNVVNGVVNTDGSSGNGSSGATNNATNNATNSTSNSPTKGPRRSIERSLSGSQSFYEDDDVIRSLRMDVLELEAMYEQERSDFFACSTHSDASPAFSSSSGLGAHNRDPLCASMDDQDEVNIIAGSGCLSDQVLLDDARLIIDDLEKANSRLHQEIRQLQAQLAASAASKPANNDNTPSSSSSSVNGSLKESDASIDASMAVHKKVVGDLENALFSAGSHIEDLERQLVAEQGRRLAAEKERDAYADAYETSMKHFEYWNRKKQQRTSPRKS